jgi:hypothetical protein
MEDSSPRFSTGYQRTVLRLFRIDGLKNDSESYPPYIRSPRSRGLPDGPCLIVMATLARYGFCHPVPAGRIALPFFFHARHLLAL